jgi:hypothetical protein
VLEKEEGGGGRSGGDQHEGKHDPPARHFLANVT